MGVYLTYKLIGLENKMSCSTYVEYSSNDRFKTYTYSLTDSYLTLSRGSSDTEIKCWDLEDMRIIDAQKEAADYLSKKVNRTASELLSDWAPWHTAPYYDPRWADETYEPAPI